MHERLQPQAVLVSSGPCSYPTHAQKLVMQIGGKILVTLVREFSAVICSVDFKLLNLNSFTTNFVQQDFCLNLEVLYRTFCQRCVLKASEN